MAENIDISLLQAHFLEQPLELGPFFNGDLLGRSIFTRIPSSNSMLNVAENIDNLKSVPHNDII